MLEGGREGVAGGGAGALNADCGGGDGADIGAGVFEDVLGVAGVFIDVLQSMDCDVPVSTRGVPCACACIDEDAISLLLWMTLIAGPEPG